MSTELAAFIAECEASEDTLNLVPEDAWARPALGEWSLHELAAHLVRQADRVSAYDDAADREPPDAKAVVDRFSYFEGVAQLAADVAQRGREQAAGVSPGEWPSRFGLAWRASAERFQQIGGDRLLPSVRGAIRADEFLATRVLEVTVHHMDLRTALDLPPAPAAEGGQLTMRILEGMLGGPRPRAMGRVRFILAATGRLASDDLRFPLLR